MSTATTGPAPPPPDEERWMPVGIVPLKLPPAVMRERSAHDERFRPPRPPELIPEEQAARSWKAIQTQCSNARMPGYSGFIPSLRAEDVFGRTQASAGDSSIGEQARRRGNLSQRSETPRDSAPSGAARHGESASAPVSARLAQYPDEHPLGKSRAATVRNHWVPTIPGYGGYLPGKYAENICGGGMTHTCKLAGRAITERSRPLADNSLEPMKLQDYAKKSQIADAYAAKRGEETYGGESGRVRLAADIRSHCETKIPGYMGHIPRVKGESIYGFTPRAANLLAADFVDDRLFNTETHHSTCCKPQVPDTRKMRV